MDWFLYDNGLRHERVKVSSMFSKQLEDQLQLVLVHFKVFSAKVLWVVFDSNEIVNASRIT